MRLDGENETGSHHVTQEDGKHLYYSVFSEVFFFLWQTMLLLILMFVLQIIDCSYHHCFMMFAEYNCKELNY